MLGVCAGAGTVTRASNRASDRAVLYCFLYSCFSWINFDYFMDVKSNDLNLKTKCSDSSARLDRLEGKKWKNKYLRAWSVGFINFPLLVVCIDRLPILIVLIVCHKTRNSLYKSNMAPQRKRGYTAGLVTTQVFCFCKSFREGGVIEEKNIFSKIFVFNG